MTGATAASDASIGEAQVTGNNSGLIASILDRSRQALLDLSLRNRLLNVPAQSKNARIVHIADELSAEVTVFWLQRINL